MNFFSYLSVELKRIFHSRTTQLSMLLAIISPMAGYKLYKTTLFSTATGDLIGNPAIAGALVGGVLFALLTLLEFDRVRKYKTGVLTDSIVSPLVLNLVRLLAIGIAAIISISIIAVLYYPYTVMKMGNVFDAYTYLNSFFLLMLPSVLLSILVASAFYQIFCRVDLSMILFIAFMILSFSKLFSDNNILHWIKPSMPELSDYFSNAIVFRLMQHNRLFWFLLLGGLWLMGLLCVRNHGKGLFRSILQNLRKVYIPLLAIVLISSAYYAYKNQPYVYEKFAINSDSVNKQLELSNTDFKISFDTSRGSLSGKAIYTLQNLSGSGQKCKLIKRPGYTIKRITANGKDIAFEDLGSNGSMEFNLPNDQKIRLGIEYYSMPKILKQFSDNLIVLGATISNKYIDLQSNNLFPTLEVAKSKDSHQITGQLTMPAGLTPVVNELQVENNESGAKRTGDPVKLLSENENNKTWFVSIGGSEFSLMAADYVVKNLSNESMPIEFYYSGMLEADMKKMSAENMMKEAINYCISHYGKLYNVSENSPLKVVQSTVFLTGGLGFSNFSTMQETNFSDKNLNDKSKGASSAEVLAHELVHQWWGIKSIGDGGNNKNWSAEGLTVYTTYGVMKEKYGEEYAQRNYVDKWKKSVKCENNNFYNRHPEYLDILPKKYAAEITGRDRVTCQYVKMPLQILKATELIGGESNMDKILAKLYQNSSKTKITWQGFLDACGLKEEDLIIE